MGIYNVAFSVVHVSGKIKYGCFLCIVHSEEEAIGLGVTYARQHYANSDGWVSHTAVASNVTLERLLEMLMKVIGTQHEASRN